MLYWEPACDGKSLPGPLAVGWCWPIRLALWVTLQVNLAARVTSASGLTGGLSINVVDWFTLSLETTAANESPEQSEQA